MNTKKKILSILIIGIFSIGLVGCSDNDNTKKEMNNNNSYSNNESNYSSEDVSSNSKSSGNKAYGLGDTFVFDGIELTLDNVYSFTSIDNRFSEHNGKSVIKLGVNVKNVSDKKHSLNMFYYQLFGSQGIELDDVTSYFDDSIDYAGELKPGASYKSYFYILYDGDGLYSIDFDNYSQELSVEFNITK